MNKMNDINVPSFYNDDAKSCFERAEQERIKHLDACLLVVPSLK